MNWFDEQIRQRIEQDDDVLDEAFITMASAVLGRNLSSRLKTDHVKATNAIGEILKFYHLKPEPLSDTITDLDSQLDHMLRPYGIMHRRVSLPKGWYRDAFGPMLGQTEDGSPVALLPAGLTGYICADPSTGKRTRINRKNEGLIQPEAMCFYRPFPLRKLDIPSLMKYVWGTLNLSDYILLGISIFVVTILGMLNPILTHSLTSIVLDSGSVRLLSVTAIFLITSAISGIIFTTIRDLLSQRIETKMDLCVSSASMMRVLTLPANFFRDFPAGDLSARMSAMNNLCNLLVETILSTGLISLSSLLYVTQIFAYTPGLVIPALAIIGIETAFTVLTALLQTRITTLQMETQAEESGMSYSIISGMRKIRLSGAEKRAFARWADIYSKKVKYTYDPPLFLKMNSVFSQMISLGGTIVIYYMAVVSRISASDYYAFEAAYATVMTAFTTMAGMALSMAHIRPVLNLVKPILEQEPEVSERKEVISRLSGSIKMEKVTFRYDPSQPPVLEDFSLNIRKGEYIAIVGKTGCGKSTLLRLLLGFETPEKGAIYYDNKNLERIDSKSLRRKVGVVMQNGTLFPGSIYENISICAPGLSMQDAWAAAETAGLAEDISDMPMGMHTIISEGGGISGGQKQRLMIARAVAPKPKIIMLDEATSALDNRTQKHVSEALDQLNCTRLVIAHRLSTIKNCSRIIVIDEGRILEDGTYEELMNKNGFFHDLVERQRI